MLWSTPPTPKASSLFKAARALRDGRRLLTETGVCILIVGEQMGWRAAKGYSDDEAMVRTNTVAVGTAEGGTAMRELIAALIVLVLCVLSSLRGRE